MMHDWLLTSPWLVPLVALLFVTSRLGRWLPVIASLPALSVAILLPAGSTLMLPWLLLGVQLQLDEAGRLFLLFSAMVWLAASLVMLLRQSAVTDSTSFRFFFLLTMAGNMLLVIAADMLTFYAGFALMGLSAYGIIVAAGTSEAKRAGRRYLVWTIIGELALFSAIVLLAVSNDGPGFTGLASRELPTLAVILILVGFGIKMALPGLHFWLPLAYRAAPAAAAAVLSGPMLSAGLLGWLRFLPAEAPGIDTWSGLFIAAGISGALLGFAGGALQRDARGVLAWSSIAKAGTMTAVLGMALASSETAPLILSALVLFSIHHLLVKAALFLGMGEFEVHGRRPWLLTGLILLSLSMAGAPWTGGAAAKSGLLESLAVTGFDASMLLTLSAVATAMLIARFLWLTARAPAGSTRLDAATLCWLVLAAAAAWLPFELSQITFSLTALVTIAAGILLAAMAQVVVRDRQPGTAIHFPGKIAWKRGDLLAPYRQRASTLLAQLGQRLAPRDEKDTRVMEIAVAGLLWLVLFAMLLSTLVLPA